jgi:hypothetical protein
MGGSSAQPRGSRYFFQHLASKVELDRLEPHTITAQDDRVVVEGSNRRTVRATGVSFEHEWVMVFTVREGKLPGCATTMIRPRSYLPSAMHEPKCHSLRLRVDLLSLRLPLGPLLSLRYPCDPIARCRRGPGLTGSCRQLASIGELFVEP